LREGPPLNSAQTAGLFKIQPIDDYSEELWDYTLDLNLKAAFFLTQQLLAPLRKAGTAEDPARVVNIGSGLGIRVGGFDAFGYQSSKAALHHLSYFPYPTTREAR
jgi:NAD(P)-dependent dehydrogenase (short-subunit alcohol dehydrogenase family)